MMTNPNFKSIYDDVYLNSSTYAENMDELSGRKDKDPFIFPIIDKFKPNSIVDLGCGQGYYLRKFLNSGIEAFGVELSSVCCEKYLSDLPHINLDIKNFLSQNHNYDFIFCTDVLEHIPLEDTKEILALCSQTAPVALFGLANHSDIQLGNQLHVIQEDALWWENLLLNYYSKTKVITNMYGGLFFFILCSQNLPDLNEIFDSLTDDSQPI